MTAKRVTYFTLLILLFTVVSLSQEASKPLESLTSANPKNTTLIDEFGKIGDCEMSARIDNLFIQLNADPEAAGFIISYAGTDFLPGQIADSAMVRRLQRAMAFRKYDNDRIVFIDGGFRESQETEFWLVPFGQVPPEPSNTVPKLKMAKNQAVLWARSWISSEEDYLSLNEFVLPAVQAKLDDEVRLADIDTALENVANEKSEGSLETSSLDQSDTLEPDEEKLGPEELKVQRFSWVNKQFASQIASQKGSHGVIIFYANDLYYDISKLQRFVEEARDIIVSKAKIAPNSILVVFGGYRDDIGVEYWLVPKGSKPPESTPTERPMEEPTENDK